MKQDTIERYGDGKAIEPKSIWSDRLSRELVPIILLYGLFTYGVASGTIFVRQSGETKKGMYEEYSRTFDMFMPKWGTETALTFIKPGIELGNFLYEKGLRIK
jgi:hypothetical protein